MHTNHFYRFGRLHENGSTVQEKAEFYRLCLKKCQNCGGEFMSHELGWKCPVLLGGDKSNSSNFFTWFFPAVKPQERHFSLQGVVVEKLQRRMNDSHCSPRIKAAVFKVVEVIAQVIIRHFFVRFPEMCTYPQQRIDIPVDGVCPKLFIDLK